MRKRSRIFSIFVATVFTITSTHSTFAMRSAIMKAASRVTTTTALPASLAYEEERYHRSRGHHKQYYADDIIDWEHTYSWLELGAMAAGAISGTKLATIVGGTLKKVFPKVIFSIGSGDLFFSTISLLENDKKTRHGIKVSVRFKVVKSRFCQCKEFKVDHCARDIRGAVQEGQAIISSCSARIV